MKKADTPDMLTSLSQLADKRGKLDASIEAAQEARKALDQEIKRLRDERADNTRERNEVIMAARNVYGPETVAAAARITRGLVNQIMYDLKRG